MHLSSILFTCILAPLAGAIIVGILGRRMGDKWSHALTILGMAVSFCCALYLFVQMVVKGAPDYNSNIYAWGMGENFHFTIGFLLDRLTAVMIVTVTFVSLLVHVYSIGYMKNDPGYARFFSYMSLFTFFMLALVCANNFLLLFFGWEGVGLVSYLLIGFWFQKESAAQGGLKAFLVNRVGDFGFILGIAAIFTYFGTLDYGRVFEKTPAMADIVFTIFPNVHILVITAICLLLFIGAMGKSAQVPLHVWLPESMEGPTPISALIHAATMVTAGVYMVARLSPLFEYSEVALSVVLVIGATGALFLGLVGLVQHDIKRVVAYSTLSQLGYMMAANGASAFSAGIFHLVTHASFKALLFLGAGSVIIAMHHEQNMQKMGGLRKNMPITYITFLIGALALAAIPPFAGFYSKDAIIEAVHLANIPGASYAYICLLLGAFVTALYIFRAFFLTFHTRPRFDAHTANSIREPTFAVTIPLIILAITSIFLGVLMVRSMLYDANSPLLGSSVFVLPHYHFLHEMTAAYQGSFRLALDSFKHLPLWFSLAGVLVAWICYVRLPFLPALFAARFAWLYQILCRKYGFDAFYDKLFVQGSRFISRLFFNVADVKLIDGFLVNGLGHGISKISTVLRYLQSGYVYHYALALIMGLFAFLVWIIF
jgi:NADH-quinone oxidoreductase subunit L